MKKAPATRKTPRRSPAKPAPKPKAKAKAAPAAPKNALLARLVAALDAKKAEQLQVFHVGEQSSITDYLILCTATSDPHLRALRIEAERVLDEEKVRIIGVDTSKGSGWTVVDAFDVMVHLFTRENRDRYRLDLLWKDATEIPLGQLA